MDEKEGGVGSVRITGIAPDTDIHPRLIPFSQVVHRHANKGNPE